MKHHERKIEFKLSSFSFTITPLLISFKHTLAQTYLLEFCKGAQILKRFGEHIWVHAEEKAYKLTNGEIVEMKFHQERISLCQWCVYRVTDDEMKDYLASVEVQIGQYLQAYLAVLKKYEVEYAKMINKEVEVEKEWAYLKRKLPFEQEVCASNKDLGIDIHFRVNIKCELDRLAEEATRKKLQKKLSKVSSKRSMTQGGGSKTNLEQPVVSNEKSSFSKVNNQVEIVINKPVNRQVEIAHRNQTLSDIIEASNECSSTMNHEQKQQLKLQSVINQIPEEEELSPKASIPSIKTHDFDRLNLDELSGQRKRSSTLREQVNKNVDNEVEEVDAYQSITRGKKIHFAQEDDTGIKDEDFLGQETAAQSDLKEEKSSQSVGNKTEQKPLNFCWLKVVFIILILGLLSGMFLIDSDEIKLSLKDLLGERSNQAKNVRQKPKKEIQILKEEGSEKRKAKKSKAKSQKIKPEVDISQRSSEPQVKNVRTVEKKPKIKAN